MLDTQARAASLVAAETRDGIRILKMDNPPVNAFSAAMSAALYEQIEAADGDGSITAIVITGANGFFSGGADINVFATGPEPGSKNVRDIVAVIEKSDKTFVAALDGSALGGGFETALACDYRIGTPKAKVGLPEILLGLIPGAGGTQRLPRLLAKKNPLNFAGLQMALQMMLDGKPKDAKPAKGMGILDEIVEGDIVDHAVAFAKSKAGTKSRISSHKFFVPPPMVALAHGMVPSEEKGGYAAHRLIDAIAAAGDLDYKLGIAREARIFDELVRSRPSQSAVHLFFAERELGKIPGLAADIRPKEIKRAAVVGAGTMGTGIAMVFANAGIAVSVIDVNAEQVERGKKNVADTYESQVKKGRLTADKASERTQSVQFVGDYSAIADADVVVEAVFESMKVKKEVFAALDAALKPGAILASNTSTLDIDEIASATSRPENVIGLHFFAPANIMALLEVVRGSKTSPETIVTSMALAKRLKKKGVLSGNAFGFIGNRMLFDYVREATFLLEEGASPLQIDTAIKNFGFPMGPFAMSDLSGIDVFYKISQEAPKVNYRQSEIATRLYEKGRYGQKTGSGFFTYEPGKREPVRDEEVERIIAAESERLGIERRSDITEDEIVERCMFALVNQGAQLLGDGIALRSGDEDVVWIFGYGFPWYHGGPMWWADTIGVKKIYDRIVEWQKTLGNHWQPAPRLREIAEANGSFAARPKIGAFN
ncbi:MAG: 3-hydroxyacyl-CoA dehydrogenase NAD-binding domain-containing protein [Candidatus Eremiobacteraeota bacterium]|nr:3-hydroxyacyl-CoA dehydrogenase NAD-binding domain-containing protein [Candidatus Eremiobacteraeota bacterium]